MELKKANAYSSYLTPKIIITFAILLIIINEPLFILHDPVTTMDVLLYVLLFIPLYIFYFLLSFFINVEFLFPIIPIFTDILVTTGTIGSIIIISIGLIYFLFPIVDYNARHLNVPIDKNKISHARFGSKLILLSGVGFFIYFIIEFTRLYEFDLLIYLLKSELYFITLLFLCIIGTVLQKYDVSSYPIEREDMDNEKQFKYVDKYDDDINKIENIKKNIKYPDNSVIDWGSSIEIFNKRTFIEIFNKRTFSYEDEIEWEFLHIRNDVESFIHVLFWICILTGVFNTFVLHGLDSRITLISFSCGSFLAIICPNAIDTRRTKNSRFATRLWGILCMLTSGIASIIFFAEYLNLNIGFVVILFGLMGMVVGILAIAYLVLIIYARLDPKKLFL